MQEDYEAKLLGLLLRKPEFFADIQRIINFDKPFSNQKYNLIYREARLLFGTTGDVNRRDILESLKKQNLTYDDYCDLITASGFPENIERYVAKVHDSMIKRELSFLSQTTINCTEDDMLTAEGYLQNIKNTIDSLESRSAVSCGVTLGEAVQNVKNKALRLSENDLSDYIRTGIRSIDRIITGFKKKTMSIVGARPSIGKSALGLTFTANMLSANHTVGFISVEMSEDECVERLMQLYSGISIDDLRKSGSKQKLDLFNKTGDSITHLNTLEISRTTNRCIMNIRSLIRSMKTRKPDLDIVFIDYLQKVQGTGKFKDRHNDVAEVSNILTDIASDLNIHVCCLAQLNRNSSEAPRMQDLKESGEIEQDASYILLIGRDLAQQYNGLIDCDAQIYITKNRGGKTGKADIRYHCSTTRFHDEIGGYDEF